MKHSTQRGNERGKALLGGRYLCFWNLVQRLDGLLFLRAHCSRHRCVHHGHSKGHSKLSRVLTSPPPFWSGPCLPQQVFLFCIVHCIGVVQCVCSSAWLVLFSEYPRTRTSQVPLVSALAREIPRRCHGQALAQCCCRLFPRSSSYSESETLTDIL